MLCTGDGYDGGDKSSKGSASVCLIKTLNYKSSQYILNTDHLNTFSWQQLRSVFIIVTFQFYNQDEIKRLEMKTFSQRCDSTLRWSTNTNSSVQP